MGVQRALQEVILIDSVEVGIQLSEELHKGLGAFADPDEPVQCNYAGPSHLDQSQGVINHWRDWGQWVGVQLQVPEEFQDHRLLLEFSIQTYKSGNPGKDPAPTKVELEINGRKHPLGEFILPDDGQWRIFEYRLDTRIAGSFALILDDRDNVVGPQDHYGKRISSIRLFAIADAPDSTETKQ